MKNMLFKMFAMACCLFLICACDPKDELVFADNHITVNKTTSKYIMFGYYIGKNKNFVIDADYVFNRHPECLMIIPCEPWRSTAVIVWGATHDGKERERTYQFIFFDGETLDKYTLTEIVERNLYDDLQILTFDQLRAADFTVTYSGPKNPN